MPLQLAKPEYAAATRQRINEVNRNIEAMGRALAPAAQRAGEGIGRSLHKVRAQRRT